MVNLFAYPYPTYVPNRNAAGCVAAVVSISLIAWFIQSCQIRFRPPRLNILLLISHLAICIELIIRAAVNADQQNSRGIFTTVNSLFAIGQRMIVVGNFVFVMEIHHEKSRLSRAILAGATLSIITSALLTLPANILSLNPDQISTSYIFRGLAASVLLIVTLLFYPVWYWSKTINDMSIQAIILISSSSSICMIVAVFNLIQSTSTYYSKINDDEAWFYAFQMAPIISAHFTWSILHPKRSLVTSCSRISEATSNDILIIKEEPLEDK